jgi:hypothetical protein
MISRPYRKVNITCQYTSEHCIVYSFFFTKNFTFYLLVIIKSNKDNLWPGCNAQENMFKLSYLILQKNFPLGSLGVGACPSAP